MVSDYNMYPNDAGSDELITLNEAINLIRQSVKDEKADEYTLLMYIMTDELRHASKYNFLIHNAK